jgi:predicted DNA-binding transcriptional regulator AlpA
MFAEILWHAFSQLIKGQTMIEAAMKIEEVIENSTFGRTTIYAAIKKGELVTRKRGRRTVVLESDYNDWIRGLKKGVASAGASSNQQPQAVAA